MFEPLLVLLLATPPFQNAYRHEIIISNISSALTKNLALAPFIQLRLQNEVCTKYVFLRYESSHEECSENFSEIFDPVFCGSEKNPQNARFLVKQAILLSADRKRDQRKETTSKKGKNRQKMSKIFSTLFDIFRAGQRTSKSSKSVKNIFDTLTIFARHPFWGALILVKKCGGGGGLFPSSKSAGHTQKESYTLRRRISLVLP